MQSRRSNLAKVYFQSIWQPPAALHVVFNRACAPGYHSVTARLLQAGSSGVCDRSRKQKLEWHEAALPLINDGKRYVDTVAGDMALRKRTRVFESFGWCASPVENETLHAGVALVRTSSSAGFTDRYTDALSDGPPGASQYAAQVSNTNIMMPRHVKDCCTDRRCQEKTLLDNIRSERRSEPSAHLCTE